LRWLYENSKGLHIDEAERTTMPRAIEFWWRNALHTPYLSTSRGPKKEGTFTAVIENRFYDYRGGAANATGSNRTLLEGETL
jgi:hypothetical protein